MPCIGVCCLHIAAKMVEEESNVSPSHELIRISQSKFTVSDLSRMEKIIAEKLCVEPKAVTALTFLHLYYSAITSLAAGRYTFHFRFYIFCSCSSLRRAGQIDVLFMRYVLADHTRIPSIF